MGDVDPCLAGGDGFLPVFCQPPTSPEPCKGAFDDPSSGRTSKPLAVSERLAISSVHLPILSRAPRSFGPGVSAVGEQMTQPGACMAYRFQHCRSAVAVLNVGCVHHQSEEHSGGVDGGVMLATVDLLSGVIAANPACLRGFSPSGCR